MFEYQTWLPLPDMLARLLLAAVLGSAVGVEREWRRRPAGLRTHILVCLSSATFAVVALELAHMPAFDDETVRLDPGRLVEAITAGVAFLSAGMIIFAGGKIHGLTTGAGIWLVGAIGLACGLGIWQVAAIATLLGLIVLWVLRRIEDRFIDGDGSDLREPETQGEKPQSD